MLEVFSLTGDPGSIRLSSQTWSQFSTATGTASDDIRRIDSGEFIGDEAETYRDKLNKDLPPHLDTTSQAWSKVSGALQTYAATLEALQQRMSTLSSQATDQQRQVDSANNAVAGAKTADAHHATSVTAAQQALKPGETLPPDHYQPQTSGASAQQADANAALQSTINAANQVHTEHNTALDSCVKTIHDAAGMRFEEPPGFWGRLGNAVGGWISDHADVLKTISSVLKTISGVAGLLAMIPVLAPIMGPIALVTGGAALIIDVGVKLATGEGSWSSIIVDGALMALPGAGRLLKGAVMATKGGQAVNRTAAAALALAKDSRAGKSLTALANSKALSAPGRGLEYVNSKVAQTLAHVPGANRLPGVKVGVLGRTVDGDGPVVFTVPARATPAEAAQMERHVNTSNDAALAGYLNPGGRVSTEGALRVASNKAARAEKARALKAGEPYVGQAGHVPDTTWINRPDPYDWHDQVGLVNPSLGRQAQNYPLGHRPTKFELQYESGYFSGGS